MTTIMAMAMANVTTVVMTIKKFRLVVAQATTLSTMTPQQLTAGLYGNNGRRNWVFHARTHAHTHAHKHVRMEKH